MDFYSEIIAGILSREITKANVQTAKIKLAAKYKLGKIPRNSEILARASEEEMAILLPVLRRKVVRTISGVAVVAVMTSPEKCPHGKCIYCPGGPDYGSAQSYTGKEPAARRAGSLEFDPYKQVRHRIEQLNAIGHSTDKIDLIVMGGTFTARPLDYQEQFIKRCFDAMNSFSIDKTGQLSAEDFGALNLEEAQLLNETAKSRCVGLTVETRPDYCKEFHVDSILRFGATRVELGVQTVYDDVLRFVERGHGVAETVEATRLCKDTGLKVCYHMMPGLPGNDAERDFQAFKTIFENSDFRPDMLKIYPALVIKGTKLYDLWKRGDYEPTDTGEAVKLLARVKEIVPPWVRIQRIERDIPTNLIDAGIMQSNIRELIAKELEARGKKCRCIRCREIGYGAMRGKKPDYSSAVLSRIDYGASGGKEIFLLYEDKTNDAIIGYLRLRVPSAKAHRPEISGQWLVNGDQNALTTNHSPLTTCAIVREIKVLGQMVGIGAAGGADTAQHKGYGASLLREAENIAKDELGAGKMLVLSGVGVREYYRKFGYGRDGAYMGKKL
ncbi:MAG: tRNA uridine(34) 5-carboxymethylaminomethyl modification radical SAM/GNAT enzyme Elp3 [Thermoplasmata archaeon HGW-Thermoplasmata-2]|nr:MAG: tRNA uridine(34) 5-carboxymethylaminomethyl modification radical SAM/GNAT enzyme Elp3 [Thermoplasmata archaeon HGW-Thermoplasmata-2]